MITTPEEMPDKGEAAAALARKGYRVFPCLPGEKKPATLHGFKDSSLDEGEIAAWWEEGPNCNVAIHTAGLLVVDFDDPAHAWLTECPDFRDAAFKVRTPRGGLHFYFRLPEGMQLGNTSKRLGRTDPGTPSKIDTRGEGGYVLVPPSRIGANSYRWDGELPPAAELPEAPTWLIEALEALERPTPATGPMVTTGINIHRPSGPELEQRAISYLATKPPAIADQGGHAATLDAARGVAWGFDIPEDRALAIMLAHYNPGCRPPWSEKELRHKVHDAATKPYSKPRGHLRDAEPTYLQQYPKVNVSGLMPPAVDGAKPAPAPRKVVCPFPDHLLYVPGFIGDVAEYANETAYKRQPVLALGAALSLLSVLTGRKVCDDYGTRTNLYSIGVCDSGGGKERTRQVNKDILSAVGLECMIGPEGLGSASGLVAAVAAQPAILFQLDEIGRILKALGEGGKGSQHLAHIPTNLIKLWSSAGSTFVSDAVVDASRVKRIVQPHAVVWGTTVQKSLYESFNADNVTDGFLSRQIIFESNDGNPEPADGKVTPIPAEILEAAAFWRDYLAPAAGTNLTTFYPHPAVVPYADDAVDRVKAAERLARDERNKSEEDSGILWTRLVEKARKLALLYACSECRNGPRVTFGAAQWACELAEYVTRKMVEIADAWASDGAYDSKAKRVLRAIQAKGQRGASRADLARSCRMPTKERAEILQGLIDAEQIMPIEVPSPKGPAATHYVAA